MESDKPNRSTVKVDQTNATEDNDDEIQRLLPLFHLLTREPPDGHYFDTCPVCKSHGITSLEA